MSQKMKTVSLTEQQVSSIRSYHAQKNLIAFTEALGYDNAPFHLEWYRYLQNRFSPLKTEVDKEKRYLLLWPRGHAKTTSTTINYPLWLVGNYRNIHINIVTKTASLAEEILTAITTIFESDPNYRTVFGNLKPRQPKKWTNREVIVARDEISKNPTLKATGLMGPITGGRSDLVICDDIIDEENIRTRLQLEKVDTWFNKVLIPTLYPWGAIIVIGTRWSYADIYAGLLEKWKGNTDIKQAIQPDGSALWPEYWSLKKLEERRDEIGSIFFNCQYQNDPTSMQGELLKSEWLHTWEELPTTLTYYAGVDPALGEGDYQGIAIIGVYKPTNQAYLTQVYAERLPFPSFLEKLKQLHQTYQFAKIFMESNSFQKILTFIPELKGLPIVPSVTVHNKESRFIPMSSHFESKRILVNPLLLGVKSEFWNEWVQFPRGQYDDALDAVEIVVRNTLAKTEPAWVVR